MHGMDEVFHLLGECSTIRNVVLLVGLLYLLRISVWIIRSLWSGTRAFILSGLFRVKLKSSSYGWAVVTGASDGIGKEYALQLAKCGINVVLMSRSMDKLKSAEKEILDQYKVTVKIIVVDFSGGAEIYDKIRMELSGLEVGILINNVGISYDCADYFLNVPDDKLWQLINVNMASVVMMTKMILPGMLDRKKGIIVNVSSTSAIAPSPLIAVYAATKVFMDYFTLALQYEYAGKGVIIQSVLPGYVVTNMTRIIVKKASFMAPSAHKYVGDALATIGVQSRTFGTMSHALMGWLLQALPTWLVISMYNTHIKGVREAIIREKQKKQ